jgi:hypothetical protein
MATRRIAWLLAMGLACMAAGVLAGCGDDDDSGGSEPNKVAISVKDAGGGKFTMTAPKTVEAGLAEITLTAPPGQESHDAQIVRVEGDHTSAEVLKYLSQEGAPTPPWLFAAGGAGSTPGGKTNTVTQVLEPGKYFIVDTSEPEGEDVPSYAEQGAISELTVTGEAGDTELPSADATITAKDYSFTTDGLKAGPNRLTFDNTGKEIHHVVVAPYAKGATFDQVKKAFSEEGEPTGPPPVDFFKTTNLAALEGGTKQVADLDLQPGKYAFVCFISDRAGGPPHVAKGMINEVTVQ